MQAKRVVLIAVFASLTAIGAFLRIPLGFSSVSLQVFFTIMAGVILGAKDGLLSQLVYFLKTKYRINFKCKFKINS